MRNWHFCLQPSTKLNFRFGLHACRPPAPIVNVEFDGAAPETNNKINIEIGGKGGGARWLSTCTSQGSEVKFRRWGMVEQTLFGKALVFTKTTTPS